MADVQKALNRTLVVLNLRGIDGAGRTVAVNELTHTANWRRTSLHSHPPERWPRSAAQLLLLSGALGGIRTPNLLIRSLKMGFCQLLLSYAVHSFPIAYEYSALAAFSSSWPAFWPGGCNQGIQNKTLLMPYQVSLPATNETSLWPT
jgi:hypothetical protein